MEIEELFRKKMEGVFFDAPALEKMLKERGF